MRGTAAAGVLGEQRDGRREQGALALLRIADSSAPKNTACADSGVCCRISVGQYPLLRVLRT